MTTGCFILLFMGTPMTSFRSVQHWFCPEKEILRRMVFYKIER